jgi:hypothetical protein
LLVVIFATLLTLTGLTGIASAKECGCTETGDFQGVATAAPAAQADSPGGGAYRLETAQNGGFATLTLKRANGTTVQSFQPPITRLQFGWSPDGNRFMYRFASAGNSQTLDDVVVYDVAADTQRVYTTVSSGAAFAFSPKGQYAFVNSITNSNSANLVVWDVRNGQTRWSTSYIFTAPPGGGGQTFSVAGTGFSQDAENRSFLLAYRDTNGQTQLAVRNLESATTVVSQSFSGGAYWRFSKCGDVIGIVAQGAGSQISVSLYKTYGAPNSRVGSTGMTLPGAFKFTNTLDQHKFSYTTTSGTQAINLGANTADTACAAAPAISSLGFTPDTLTGSGKTATGKVTFTSAPSAGATVALSSSDTSALTVPSSTTVASGSTTKTFTVTSKAVTSTKTVTVTATYNGVSKTATVTVNPAATTVNPKVATLNAAAAQVAGGSATTATVILDVAAPASGTTVALSSDSPVAQLSATTQVTPGATTKTFTIQTSAVTNPTPVTITATTGGQSRTAAFTVIPAATDVESPHAVIDDAACRAQTLQANDDDSSAPIALPFQMNFFGVQRGAVYVNNNGNVTFDSPLSEYTPFNLAADTPAIIAPFFADVDTRGTGSGLVTWSAPDAPMTYAGRPAFCANWIDVGYYGRRVDKTNSFQLILVDRSDVAPGDFDIVYNYDRIAWETGDASSGSNGYGGSSAGAGYSAGTGNVAQFYNIPGTLVNGAFLDTNTETGLTRTSRGTLQRGRQIFEVRNGSAPTGGIVEGTVSDGNDAPLPGSPVALCPDTGLCVATTVTGASGRFRVSGVPAGSYQLRVNPPAGSTLSAKTDGPFDVTAGATTVRNVVLTGPTGPAPGTTISPSNTNGQGIPSVYWGDDLDLDTEGCVGGTATYKITQGATAVASGPMTEKPDGHFTAHIPALRPVSGMVTVTIAIDCPGDTPDQTQDFNLYIDPSGNVRDLDGNAIAGATVTLYRSDSESGPFEIVPDGSAIMSPSNRVNPMVSDAEGHFGWDVMPGFYMVRAQKDGCTARDGSAYVETAVLPVPPPVFDLDLRLVCEQPSGDVVVDGVTDGASYGDSTDLVVTWTAPGGAASTATLDGTPVASGDTVALHRLPLGAHALEVTAGSSTTTVRFTTYTSFDDVAALIARFRSAGGITQAVATSLSDRLAKAAQKAGEGHEKAAIGYLEQFVARAMNQIKGNMDRDARDVLVRDATALIAEQQALDDDEGF